MAIAAESEKAAAHDIKPGSPVIVDLGKKSRKQIRQMRNGTGKLLDEVQEVVDHLKAEGTVDKNAQPIVIVVRQRRRKTNALFPFA
jgi:hypothetical protein